MPVTDKVCDICQRPSMSNLCGRHNEKAKIRISRNDAKKDKVVVNARRREAYAKAKEKKQNINNETNNQPISL